MLPDTSLFCKVNIIKRCMFLGGGGGGRACVRACMRACVTGGRACVSV